MTNKSDQGAKWDERYLSGEYRPRSEASSLIKIAVEGTEGSGKRCLEVACGNGRNAVYLAERGYEVDAIDVSTIALSRAKERGENAGVNVNWILADIEEFEFVEEEYDVIIVDFFFCEKDMIQTIKKSLKPGGMIIYEHHIRTEDRMERGPSKDKYRFKSNELLNHFRELTVLYYKEGIRRVERGSMAVASLVARKTKEESQKYPDEIGGSMSQK